MFSEPTVLSLNALTYYKESHSEIELPDKTKVASRTFLLDLKFDIKMVTSTFVCIYEGEFTFYSTKVTV